MRVCVIYKSESDYARTVIDFLRDVKRQTGYDLEEVNPDTSEGAQLCRVYDIVEYPTIVAVDGNGGLQSMWRGLPLPTISEVGYYASMEENIKEIQE
jgi:hypothetical protein